MFAVGKIASFWQGRVATGDPKLEGHPMLQEDDWQNKYVPCFTHGDGVEMTDTESVLVYSFGSLVSSGSSQDTSLLMALWPKSATLPATATQEGTWRVMLLWLAWSLTALFWGLHPTLDPWGAPFPPNSEFGKLAGKPLTAAGYRCCLWALEGDQDYFANVLKMAHWNNENPCWACDCLKGHPELDPLILMPGKQRWTIRNAAAARAALRSDHPFVTKVPGVTSLMVAQDALHILFCKGILSHLMGSALHIWCWPTPGARNAVPPARALASIFSRVQQLYREHSCRARLTNLRLSMFTDPDKPHKTWPTLHIKAAECKHLLKPLAVIALERAASSTDLDMRIASCFVEMSRLVDILDEQPDTLTAEAHLELTNCALRFFGHYEWLNAWGKEQERYVFHKVIKFHMFHHLIIDAKYLNPRAYWCFKGEDYVGRIARLAASCAFGVSAIRLSQKVAAKYRHWLHVRLTRGDYHDAHD